MRESQTFNHETFQTIRVVQRVVNSTMHCQDLTTVNILPYLLQLYAFVLGHFKVNYRHYDALLQNF